MASRPAKWDFETDVLLVDTVGLRLQRRFWPQRSPYCLRPGNPVTRNSCTKV